MISKIAFNTTAATAWTELVDFLSACGYFDDVSYEDSIVSCKDADENTILTIRRTTPTKFSYYISAEVNSSVEINVANFAPIYAYSCSKGIIIIFTNNYYHLLITKSNNDKVIFVAPTSSIYNLSELSNANKILCQAFGDEATNTQTYSFTSGNQTILRPFGSNNALGTPSYAPDAFSVSVGQYPNMGYGAITIDDVLYLSNGYWAIKDE